MPRAGGKQSFALPIGNAKTSRTQLTVILMAELGTIAGNCNKPTSIYMTSIPTLAFGADAKKNLDTAVKFLVAGALPSPAIVAMPAHTPAIPASAANRGVLATLLPLISYTSKAQGTDWRSNFSVLLPVNIKLAAMLGSTIAAVGVLAGAGNVSNLAGGGVDLAAVTGVTNLETLIYSLAESSTDVSIAPVVISGVSYLKLSADYVFTPAVDGGGSPQ